MKDMPYTILVHDSDDYFAHLQLAPLSQPTLRDAARIARVLSLMPKVREVYVTSGSIGQPDSTDYVGFYRKGTYIRIREREQTFCKHCVMDIPDCFICPEAPINRGELS